MFPFTFTKAGDEDAALAAGTSGARYIAGGTTLVDLMRETVEQPEAVVDINGLPYRSIELGPTRLRVGSLVRMSELAAHPGVRRQFPVIVERSNSVRRPSCGTWPPSVAISCRGPAACTSAM